MLMLIYAFHNVKHIRNIHYACVNGLNVVILTSVSRDCTFSNTSNMWAVTLALRAHWDRRPLPGPQAQRWLQQETRVQCHRLRHWWVTSWAEEETWGEHTDVCICISLIRVCGADSAHAFLLVCWLWWYNILDTKVELWAIIHHINIEMFWLQSDSNSYRSLLRSPPRPSA